MSDHAAEAALIKTKQHIEETQGKIIASISGGADSDVMLDLIERARGGGGALSTTGSTLDLSTTQQNVT